MKYDGDKENKIVAIISSPFLDDPNSIEQAKYLEQKRQTIQKLVESTISQKMGKILSMIQGDYVVELDIENADALIAIERDVKRRYRRDVLIGVGDDLSQAKCALKHLEETDQVGIQVYRHEMENDPDDPIDDDKPIDDIPTSDLHTDPVLESKALNETDTDPENPDTVNPNSSAVATENSADQPDDSEINTKPLALPAAAAPVQPPQPDQGEQTPEEGEPVENMPPELKSKVADMLQNIQQNKQVFDSMKDSSPELYQNVVGIVQSMVGIIKDTHANTQVPDESKDIKRHIDKQVEKHAKSKDDDHEEMMEQAKKRGQQDFAQARDHAKENGGDPKFYYLLLRALK